MKKIDNPSVFWRVSKVLQKPRMPAGVSVAAKALCMFVTMLFSGAIQAAEANIAVAANFTSAMKRIAADFERETGHTLVLSFGSTGQFYAQIKNGAPFAAFLAADDETPHKLEKEGLAVAGTRFTYATGRLVLWSAKPGYVDDRGDMLKSANFERIAIANPKLAPYGAAAFEVLDGMGLRTRISARVVEGNSITQTYQFVASGNAQLGFVALSQVFENGAITSGSGWVVPAALHQPIRQDAVLLNTGRSNPAALALLKYLQNDKAGAVIRALGYER